jgi:hypothetical protein
LNLSPFLLNLPADAEVDINDPEFWNKWARSANLNPEELLHEQTAPAIMFEPRQRKQGAGFPLDLLGA